MILHSLYHGGDRKQCFYEPNCMCCYLKCLFTIIWVARRR